MMVMWVHNKPDQQKGRKIRFNWDVYCSAFSMAFFLLFISYLKKQFKRGIFLHLFDVTSEHLPMINDFNLMLAKSQGK